MAEYHYKRAVELSKEIPLDAAYSRGYLAEMKYLQGDYDSALLLIRGVPEIIKGSDSDYFKSCAANIYYSCGKYDSARIYALDVIKSNNLSYRVVGYKQLLKPELRNTFNQDTIAKRLEEYRLLLSERYNEHDAQAVIAKNSYYNYSLHMRESQRLARSRERMLLIIIIQLSLCVIALFVIARLSRVATRRKERLRSMLDTISQLNQRLEAAQAGHKQAVAPTPTAKPAERTANLRERLRDEISRLKQLAAKTDSETPRIAYTTIDRLIKEAIDSGRIPTDNDPIWTSVKKKVNAISPEFEPTLNRLSGGKLSPHDVQLASLIRLGIPSNQIAQLFGRSKGAITYRRKQLCSRAFGDQISITELDSVIRCI